MISAYQNQADPYAAPAGQSPVPANTETMSNLSALMMQGGMTGLMQPPPQQQHQGAQSEAAAGGDLSSLPNLLVESGDLTQNGNKMDDLSGTFSANLRLSMGVAKQQGDGGAAPAGLNTPDVSASGLESKNNVNRM